MLPTLYNVMCSGTHVHPRVHLISVYLAEQQSFESTKQECMLCTLRKAHIIDACRLSKFTWGNEEDVVARRPGAECGLGLVGRTLV